MIGLIIKMDTLKNLYRISDIQGFETWGPYRALVAAARIVQNMTEQAPPETHEAARDELCRLLSLPNCNDCLKAKVCEYAPMWGECVRINCPLHEQPKPDPAADVREVRGVSVDVEICGGFIDDRPKEQVEEVERLKREVELTRQFIHRHGLEFALATDTGIQLTNEEGNENGES